MGAWWKGYCTRACHLRINARNWQFGRINEGMTPKQCHATHCNSQQVEGNAGWDRHSSGDLRNRQMDSQDEGSRRIYITREISRKGDDNSEDTRKFYWWSIRRKEEEFILGRGPRTDLDPLLNYAVDDPVSQWSCLTVDEVLTKAQFLNLFLYQIHCIGLVGFGLAHIYSERPPPPKKNRDPTHIYLVWSTII